MHSEAYLPHRLPAEQQYQGKSQEELRFEDYQAGVKNAAAGPPQQQAAPASPFGATGGFGASQPAPAFGAAQSVPAFGGGAAPAFGATSAPTFGSPSAAPAFGGSATFGSPPQAGAFGAPQQQQPASAGAFGFGASTTGAFGAAPAGGGLFGGAAPASGGLFGGATQTGSIFGPSTPSFGSQPAASTFSTGPSLFGGAGAPTQGSAPAAGGFFGGSTFGAASSGAAGGLFGSSTGAFGAQPAKPAGFSFSSAPASSECSLQLPLPQRGLLPVTTLAHARHHPCARHASR